MTTVDAQGWPCKAPTVWHPTKLDPYTVTTRDGHIVTFGRTEWARSDDGGPLTFRHHFAVTFPEDGRTIAYTTLNGCTPGEAVQYALMRESWGPAYYTRTN